MKKENEFEARVYKNKANNQYSLIPIKKNLSPEVRALMEDPNIIGFKIIVVKKLKEMPTPKLKVDWKDPKAVREYSRIACRNYYRRKKARMKNE